MRHLVIDNRYRLLSKLGAGAMGDVYKALDSRNNQTIALKILSQETTSSESVQRFKREFKLLVDLHHPNLCQVYDFGMLKDGRSYFTMEYIDGFDIFSATKNLSYEKIYPFVVDLCRALEYIHAKGLIHYDIKPGNVLIAKGEVRRAEGAMPYAKLLDFGLAGEHELKGGGTIKGTLPYIAPEVIKGSAVDHRADLYSLGNLLYEIFTRHRLAAKEETSLAALLTKLEQGIRKPSAVVPDIPKRLEHLILKLTAFDPSERYSRANEVIKELSGIADVRYELETEKTLEGYLLSSKFVGREKEMATLKSLLGEARQGHGKVVLITGDAGIGKSRLLREFRTYVQLAQGRCFLGYAYKQKTTPLQSFYDVFRELINVITPDLELPTAMRFSLAVSFKMFPELTNGHLRRNLPHLVPLEPQAEKLRTFDALTELVKHIASNLGDLVILLEDLHWADDLTIQFLEYLGRNLEDRRILICGTIRQRELLDNAFFNKMMTKLKNEGYLREINLNPLTITNVMALMNSTITPASNSIELTRFLMNKTNGNPFHVEQLTRALVHRRGISIGKKIELQTIKKIPLPETLEDMILKDINELETDAQKVVKYSAVLLKDFTYDLMKRLTKFDDTELSRILWQLRRQQVLIERDNRYKFYHPSLREAVIGRLAPKERRELSYHVGRTLETINRGRIEKVVDDLAYYFIDAQDRKQSIKYGIRAAKRSSERYANAQAIELYKGVLNVIGNKHQLHRFEIEQRLADVEALAGCYNDAIRHYYDALNMKGCTFNKKIEIYGGIARIHVSRGEYKEAINIHRQALNLLKKMRRYRIRPIIETDLKVKMAIHFLAMGDYKKAKAIRLTKLLIVKRSRSRKAIKLQSRIYANMGIIEYIMKRQCGNGDFNKAIDYFKKAYECFKKAEPGRRVTMALNIALNNLGGVYLDGKFDYPRSLHYFEKALEISERIGDQYGACLILGNIGLLLKAQGNYFRAIDCLQRAFAIAKKTGAAYLMALSSTRLGACYLMMCDSQKSKDYFEKGYKFFDMLGIKDEIAGAINGMGHFHESTGHYQRALEHYRKTLKISRTIGNQNNIGDSLVAIADVLVCIGLTTNARRHVEDAMNIATRIDEKVIQVGCYILFGRIDALSKNYDGANANYQKGIELAEKIGMKRECLQLFLLRSAIDYETEAYSRGLKIANEAMMVAKAIGAKDLFVEGLLLKLKNNYKQRASSQYEAFSILSEATGIAEEIGNPEILWMVYYEYGRMLAANKQPKKAAQYYQKCIDVFRSVVSRLKSESQKQSYLNRPDRKAALAEMGKIK